MAACDLGVRNSMLEIIRIGGENEVLAGKFDRICHSGLDIWVRVLTQKNWIAENWRTEVIDST